MSFEFNSDNPIVVISSAKYRDLLISSICVLSTKIQKKYIRNSNGTGNAVILNIENEAMYYIEQVILDIFNSILSIGESDGTSDLTHSIYSNDSFSLNKKQNVILNNPIKSVSDAELRVRRVLPRNYTDVVCSKAQSNIEKYNSIKSELTGPSKGLKFLRTFASNTILNNSLTNQFISSASNELAQIFIFPFDKIYEILCKDVFNVPKLDINIAIYLVSVLEFIASDILHLTSTFVRYLNKYTITKQDLSLAISAEPIFINLLNTTSTNAYNKGNNCYDLDEMSNLSCSENSSLISNESSNKNFELNKLNRSNMNSVSSVALNEEAKSIISSSISNLPNETNEECVSDCSTICPDSFEKLKEKYLEKVKELILEQNQHLNDLNILRRIFMYWLTKYYTDNQNSENIDIEDMLFGNINEVYECALRLTDLLDDVMSSSQHKDFDVKPNNNINECIEFNQSQDINLVGAQFWELAEGNEFDVYLKYATTVTNKNQISSVLKMILSNQNLYNFLQQKSIGLGDITRYLLPQLLLGSVYHILYLYETVEYLFQISFEKDDKEFLKDSLDTLKQIKFELEEIGFIRSKFRPIETSFKMFQPHQLNLIRKSLTNETSSNVTNIFHPTFNNNKALSGNISTLTQAKWRELEQNLDNDNYLSKLRNKNNIRYAFLYEGQINICKTNQPLSNQIEMKNFILNQSKIKVSNRYAYLFEDQIILVKRPNDSHSKYKLKQIINLNNCHLNDRLDDCCFELQLANTNTHSSFFFHHQHYSSSNGNSGAHFNDQVQFIFITETPKQKHEWMSMLCFSLYKFNIDRLLQLMNEEHNKNNPLPIPPKGYIFDHPDTPDTILFDIPLQQNLDKDLSSLSTSEPVNGFTIRAATLVKLIEHLTHPLYLYQKLSDTFLMVYKEFTNSSDLLNLLIQRYDVPNLSFNDLDTNEPIILREISNRYRREYQKPIKLKVINFIKHWIEKYYEEDFQDEETQISQTLNEFIEKVGKSNKNLQQVLTKAILRKKYSKNLFGGFKSKSSNSIDLNSSEEKDNLKTLFKTNLNCLHDEENDNQEMIDMPSFEVHLENMYAYDILTIHPLELARQATLMEFELFSLIKSKELIKCGWNKPKEKYKLSPNVVNLINFSNKFTYWYCKCIVDTLNFEERVAVVQRILDIAGYFYELKNFSGMKQIFAALESSSVVRLKLTREKAGLEQHEMYKIFKNLFDTGHDKGYLDKLRTCSNPCLPFIGSHLTNIYRKYEHNKLYLNDQNKEDTVNNPLTNLINFSKYRLIYQFINDLLQYQTSSYKFRVNHNIRKFLVEDIEKYFDKAYSELRKNNEPPEQNNAKKLVEEYIYEKSKQIESEFEYYKYPKIRYYALKTPSPSSQSNVHKILNISSKIIGNKINHGSSSKLDQHNKDDVTNQSILTFNDLASSEDKYSKSIFSLANDLNKKISPNNLISASSTSLAILDHNDSLALPPPTTIPPPPPSDPPPRPLKDRYHNKFKSALKKDNIQPITNKNKFYIEDDTSQIEAIEFKSRLKNEKNSEISSSSSFIDFSSQKNGKIKSPLNNSNVDSRLSSSSMIFPLASSSSTNMNLLHSSPKLTPTFLSPFLYSSENSIQLDKLDLKVMRKVEDSSLGFYQEKLSSSSSSVPNSPPPDYSDVCNDSEVFESERSPTNCYDNKTYFQKVINQPYTTLSDVNNNKTVFNQKKNQNIFHFPDSASSIFSDNRQQKLNRMSAYELSNHFHSIDLPPPPSLPPPPPMSPSILITPPSQVNETDLSKSVKEISKNTPPVPKRPK